MEVMNCKGCGKLFNYIGAVTPMCPQCMRNLDDKYESVKQFIYDHPNANINEVSIEMDVSIQQIQRWIRQERLSFSDSSPIGIECEKCGAMIKTGRFCNMCKAKMKTEIGSVIPQVAQMENLRAKDASARMRYLDSQKIKNE